MAQANVPENKGFMASKYVKMLMVILMAFLLFGGPYFVYLIYDALGMSFLYAFIAGCTSILLGLVLMWYLIKVKIIT